MHFFNFSKAADLIGSPCTVLKKTSGDNQLYMTCFKLTKNLRFESEKLYFLILNTFAFINYPSKMPI